jgi:2-keto-4-pentenoate hydratase/2-oxohepta-3-ene-1,7-dioic acid hydratase in catechol pathway
VRWVTFSTDQSAASAGLLVDDRVHSLPERPALVELLGDDGERLHNAGERALRDPAGVTALDEVTVHAPIPSPPTVRDFYAFEQHVKTVRAQRGLEMDPDWYERPVFYFSNPSCVTGPYDDVAGAPGSNELDYEVEVAVIVGRAGRNVGVNDAGAYIAGYTVMNDWSARDLQRREMKMGMGPVKGKDFATTLGPILLTPEELSDVRKDRSFDLTMTASVNGREYSRANLSDIYWSFEEMISYASRGTSISPGDVIGSGTCGTGCILELSSVHGGQDYPWLKPGDIVEIEVERIGKVKNRVVQAESLQPLR